MKINQPKILTFFTGFNYLLRVSAVSTEQSTEQTQGVDGCVFLAYQSSILLSFETKKKDPRNSSKQCFSRQNHEY